MCALPASSKAILTIGGAYLACVNLGSAALFWYDKQQAIRHGWRIPERTLQLTALLGGWIGGFWAMDKFRHKTKKVEFLYPYYACVGGNVALSGGLFYYVKGNPASKQQLNEFLNSKLGRMVTKEVMNRLKRLR